MKGKGKVSNITAAGIDAIKIYTEKWKIRNKASYKNFHLVWVKVKNVLYGSLKKNRLIYHSQRRRNFTNYIKII